MPNKFYAHILLDRSGSMSTNRDMTIGAINEYLNGLAVDPELDANVSITLFDTNSGVGSAGIPAPNATLGIPNPSWLSLETICDNQPVKTSMRLTPFDYVPRGSTPLNDAIGKTVALIDAQTRREGERVALVIMTDGLENASHEFSKEAVKALLDARQKEKGWLVIYLGADHDAFVAASAYGVSANNTMNFNKMSQATNSATMSATLRGSIAYATSDSYSEGLEQAAFTAEERDKAAKK